MPRPRQPFATLFERSRGRLHPEDPSRTRSAFQRDRDRILHSTAFRRLKHKTQVFVEHEGDHHRTRLTHSLEVSQIARSIARALGLDEDLAEALALAHDLGHTPFGHTGEEALDAAMRAFGGFDHNAQTLRIVTSLERRYAAFDGLNLSWETLEGLAKHNGAVMDRDGTPVGRYLRFGVPAAIAEYNASHDLELYSLAGPEAQAAALADDIAYDAHDIDDGLRACLFDLDMLRDVPFIDDLLRDIERRWPRLERTRTVHELQRRVITGFVEDVIETSEGRLAALQPTNVEAIRAASAPVIAFSPRLAAADRAIKGFLFPHMYRHETIVRVRLEAARVVTELFEAFMTDPKLLPPEWRAELSESSGGDVRTAALARHVADYIAGMTDRYALQVHQRLFDDTPDLR